MNRTILNQIKRAIKRKLDVKAGQIISTHGTFLSKYNLTQLIGYMNKNNSYSYSVIRYIFYVSPYRHEFDPLENSELLYITYDYPDIVELLWSDIRVVQDYKTSESVDVKTSSNRNTYYAAQTVLDYGCSQAIRAMLKIVESPDMLGHALERSVCNGYTDIVRLLCEPQYFMHLNDAEYKHIFISASMIGSVNMVRILLEACKDTDTKPKIDQDTFDRVMRVACDGGKLEIVELLLRDGRSNPGYKSNMPIYYACAGNNPNTSIIRLLLEDERVNPFDPTRPSYYHPMPYITSFEILQILFKDGRYDLKWGCEMIRSAMARFVGATRIRIVRLLLTDSRIVRRDLSSVIKYAKSHNHKEIEAILVAAQSSAIQSDAERTDIEQKNIET